LACKQKFKILTWNIIVTLTKVKNSLINTLSSKNNHINYKNILNSMPFTPCTVIVSSSRTSFTAWFIFQLLYPAFRLFFIRLFQSFHQGKFRNLIKYRGVGRTHGGVRRMSDYSGLSHDQSWAFTSCTPLLTARLY